MGVVVPQCPRSVALSVCTLRAYFSVTKPSHVVFRITSVCVRVCVRVCERADAIWSRSSYLNNVVSLRVLLLNWNTDEIII